MAKTIVNSYKIWDYDKKSRVFRTSKEETLWVNSFENGVAVVEPMVGVSISSFIEMIVGCFHKESNFTSELFKAFECDENTVFTGIQSNINLVTLLVTKENADKDKIYAEWKAGMKANEERERLEWEAYIKTPEYRAKKAKQLKIQTRIQQVENEVLAIDESTELEFKDDEAKANWEKWVEVNSNDNYSFGVVKYARRWAKYMQHLMKKHNKTLPEIAENASHVSDIEGVSGYMYGIAVAVLSKFWKYGKELRSWNNK